MTLADAMGKGTGPALVAATVRASLRTAPERSLSDAVIEVDRLLEDDLADTSMFVTAVVAELRPETESSRSSTRATASRSSSAQTGRGRPCAPRTCPWAWGWASPTPGPGDDAARGGDAFICCSDGLLDVLDADDPFGHVERVLTAMGPDGAVREALRLANDERATDDITVVVVRRDA